MIYVLLFGTVIAGWSLISGWRAKDMTPVGGIYFSAKLKTAPVRFWLTSLYNAMLVLAGIALVIEELNS